MKVFSVIAAGILWGLMSIFVKGLSDSGFDSRQIMMIRSVISAICLAVIIFIKDRSLFKIKIRDLWMFLCSGILSLSFFSVCYFSSILENGASAAVVLLYTSPVFVLLLSALFFKEKISRYKIAALILTVAGCILVTGIYGTVTENINALSLTGCGILLGLGSGLGYGLYSIFGTLALKKYRPLTVTFYSFLIAGLFMIPVTGHFENFKSCSFAAIRLFAGVSIFCTLIPFLLYTWGLKGLDAGKAAIFATAEPLAGTIVGIFVWHESTGIEKITGILLIFMAIIICRKSIIPHFLKKHHFKASMIVRDIIYDMSKANGGKEKRGQDMFRTWMNPPEKNPASEKVIVIDAGGTNFRSCLVTFDIDGKAIISDFQKSAMPAIEREYSKDEFFAAIADRIEYLRDKTDKIGFCFSYAMNITKDHDGIPNAFSKEIKAREVLGVAVGKSLKEELEKRGWNPIRKITLLNDTVAALLAGCTSPENYESDSFIGFILGTGMNAAFIDEENHCHDGKQIIVCESGKCNEITLSDFDIEVDKKTDVPGQYPLEKCCSGAYLGKVGYEMLKKAAEEKIFTKGTCKKILRMNEFSTIEMNRFLVTAAVSEGENGIVPGVIGNACETRADRQLVFELLDAAVNRCAMYAASILAANLVVCGKGKNKEKPVCIVMNGTTLYKTYKLKDRIEKYLYKFATKKCHIWYKTVQIENDITAGTAVAALI